jgi:hypothetical protein
MRGSSGGASRGSMFATSTSYASTGCMPPATSRSEPRWKISDGAV